MNLGVLTTSRADYGLLRNVILKLKKNNLFNVKLFVSGSHLHKKFGFTINEILDDKIKISEKIAFYEKDPHVSIPEISKKFSFLFLKNNINFLMLLGDRFEVFAAALGGFLVQIPLIHIHGGEKTFGSIDDTYRHLISKMSSIHFVSTKVYFERLKRLGENPKNIFNIGALSIESIKQTNILDKKTILKILKINSISKQKIILCCIHPETQNPSNKSIIISTLNSLKKLDKCIIVFTFPNMDKGNDVIIKQILKFNQTNENVYIFKSLGSQKYYSLLKHSNIIVGNSSSGILEAPILKTPTINIGNRQLGRVKGSSVYDCVSNPKKIYNLVNKVLNMKKINFKHPYGNGNTSDKINNIITRLIKNNKICFDKEFYD